MQKVRNPVCGQVMDAQQLAYDSATGMFSKGVIDWVWIYANRDDPLFSDCMARLREENPEWEVWNADLTKRPQ